MKAITIQQPWAWAIAAGHKRVENRKTRCHYRGPIAIHAGKSEAWLTDGLDFLRAEMFPKPLADQLVYGAVIATAELVDCVPCTTPGKIVRDGQIITDPFAFGPWCWILANVQPLATPFPCRGQQTWFNVELEGVTK